MSHIDDLIRDLCPDGVEYKTLGEICRIRNGSDYKANGDGEVPVYGTGGIMTTSGRSIHPGPSVLIPRKGSLNKLYYVDNPFWVVDTIFYTEIDQTRVLPKYLFHLLLTQHLEDLNEAGGVPSLTQTVLNKLLLPIPPLEVQRAIVEILDSFTKLEAELEAELEARRKQYAHYRDALLTFPRGVRWLTLGDVCTKVSSGGTPLASRRDYYDGDNPMAPNPGS